MRSHNFGAGALALLLASAGSGVADGQSGKPRFGKPISEADIAAWNIDVRTPDGKNLPSGKGSVSRTGSARKDTCSVASTRGYWW